MRSVVQEYGKRDHKVSDVSELSKKFTAGKLTRDDIICMNGTINQVYNFE
jgi:hypothetical protein